MSYRGEMISFKQITQTKLGKAHKQGKNANGVKKIGFAEKSRLIKQDVASMKVLVEGQIALMHNEIKNAIIENDFEGLSQAIETIAQKCHDQMPKHLVQGSVDGKCSDALKTLIGSHVALVFIDEIVSLKPNVDAMVVHLGMLLMASI